MKSSTRCGVVLTLAITCGCTSPAVEPSPDGPPDELAQLVFGLLNQWDADRYRAVDFQPNDGRRQEFYETHCFRPMNNASTGGLRFRITKSDVGQTETRVQFDILFDGQLTARPQETDPNQPDLFDRGQLLLVRVGDQWKLKEISF